jgi:hypothetical protein
MGAHFYHFVFDQNEPFMGHVSDRQTNRKAKKHLKSFVDRILSTTTGNMREVPALQMADLFAWCVSQKGRKPRFRWQNRLLNQRDWFHDWFGYDQIVNPIPGVPALVKSWNLPRRKPTK